MVSVISLLFPAATFATRAQTTATHAGGIAPWKLAGASVSYWDSEVRLNLNGTTRVVATDDPNRLDWTFATDAVVSLDGRSLAYVAADDCGYTNATITVVDLTSGAKTVVARPGSSIWPLLRWSPDSRQLAYATQQPGTGNPQVYIVDVTGTNEHLALSGGTFTRDSLQGLAKRSYGWSADGKSLIFHDNAVHPKTRWTVSLATGTRSSAPYAGDSGSGATSPSPDVIDPGGGGSWACNVPLFSQNAYPWNTDIMQTGGHTIANSGCTLTSATMVLDYYGATKNPRTMNECMGPYADGFTWIQAINRGCDEGHTAWSDATDFYGYFDCNVLHDRLYSGQPVIIKMTGGSANTSHFVVAMNWGNISCPTSNANLANYISINDPRDGVTKTLSDYTSTGASLIGMRVYRPRSGTWPACHF